VNSSSITGDARADAPAPGPRESEADRGTGPSSEVRATNSGLLQARWLTRLLETGPQPFAIVDLAQRIIGANRAFSALVGYSTDELLGMPVLDLTARDSQDLTRRYHADILATGKNERLIKNYRHKEGRSVPVELMVDVFRDDAGNPVGLYAFITDISDRIRAEEAVRDSEQRYHQLYDEAPVGYHEVDCGGRIVSINRTACELLGYESSELIGRSVLELIAPEERETAGAALHQKFAGDRLLIPYEQVLVTRDGRRLTTEIQEREHRGSDGQIAGLRSVVQDISRRKETEAALVESERRARALFDGIHDAVFVHDQDGRILDANPAACWQLGYSRDELLKLRTSQIDAPEFAAGFQDRLRTQLQQGQLTCEGLHRTKSGKLIPVEVTTSTIQFGSQLAILAIFRDITERKALERTRRELASAQMQNAQEMELKNRALSESESRYRRLSEGSLDAIVVADGEGRVSLFNPAAEKIFGYQSREILGGNLEQLIPGMVPAEQAAVPGRSIRHSPVVGKTVELTGRRRDGTEFPLELSLSAIEMDGHAQYIGSIRDQTERQRMRAMLAHTDKLASIGLLSAGVAHEINNPLAYVQNNLVVLQREVAGLLDLVRLYDSARVSVELASPQTLHQIDELIDEIDWPYVRDNLEPMIERTRSGVKRVASIVEKMRGLARTSPPKWEVVSLRDLVESALEMMRGRLTRERIDVVIEIHDVTQIECVPDQIGQVLLNLLINALQAIEGTGQQEGGRIEVDGRLSGPWVAISVTDNGPGIEPDVRDRLFDPFFTTKPVGEGTGLGLAITHGIISGHGGQIEIDSRPGQGSCFRILLPRHQHSNPPPAASSPIPSSAPA
jgi:PAS domain S-box-containing protein